jgi:hypothetical protein
MKKRIANKYITSLLLFTAIFVLVLPSIGNADLAPSRCEVGVSWQNSYPPNWDGWKDLHVCDQDAEGFQNKIVKGLSRWYAGFDTYGLALHDEQWEYDDDQDFVDSVDFAYYAGHGNSGTLVFHACVTPYDSADLVPDRCDWGDEGPLNWVALACCYAGQNTYRALDGLHLICGWRSPCTDAIYGPVFAQKLIDGEEVKTAWFQTGQLLAAPGLTMNVVGEDYSVGTDHMWHCGHVNPTPPDDDEYYEWTFHT